MYNYQKLNMCYIYIYILINQRKVLNLLKNKTQYYKGNNNKTITTTAFKTETYKCFNEKHL